MFWPASAAALVCSMPYPTNECGNGIDTCYPICPCTIDEEFDYTCVIPGLTAEPIPRCCVVDCLVCDPPAPECECRADRTWVRIPHGESNAPALGGAVAFNPELGRVMMFGGRAPSDWLRFDPDARRWQALGYTDPVPEPFQPPESCSCQTGLIWKPGNDASIGELNWSCADFASCLGQGDPGQDPATIAIPRATVVEGYVAECVETCGCEDGLYAALTNPELCALCEPNPCTPECLQPTCEEMLAEWEYFWTGQQDPDAMHVLPVGATEPNAPNGFEARCRKLSDPPDYTASVEGMAIAYDPGTNRMIVVGGCRTRPEDDGLPSDWHDCTGSVRWFDPETGEWSADDGRGEVDWFGGQEISPGHTVHYTFAGFDQTGGRLVTRGIGQGLAFGARAQDFVRVFAMDAPSPNLGDTFSDRAPAYGFDPVRDLVVALGLPSSTAQCGQERWFQTVDEGARYIRESFPVDSTRQHLIFDETRSLFLMFGGSSHPRGGNPVLQVGEEAPPRCARM